MIQINGVQIGPGFPPYIVAEVSGNHCGDLDRAMSLVVAAKQAGCSAVKFQCYEPDDITIDCDTPDFVLKDGPWKGRKLYELYQSAHTPYCWFPQLFEHAKQCGITAFASVFSKRGVDHLEALGCPAYKIASMEIVDTPLISYAARTKKPIIISTGMATEAEIDAALRIPQNPLMLHCVSGYPTPIEEADLHNINHLRYKNGMVGISDHSTGLVVPIAAVAAGACMIEKHLCLRQDDPSEDAAFSLDPDEMREMVRCCQMTWQAMQPSLKPSQESSKQARRSLYVVEDIPAGHTITAANIRSIRPAGGLPPELFNSVLGMRVHSFVKRGTPVSMDFISP